MNLDNLRFQEQVDRWEEYGCVFEASALLTLQASANDLPAITPTDAGYSFTAITAGSKPLIIYSREVSFDGVGFYAYLFRDPVFTGGTSTQDGIRNSNDINPKTPEFTITPGINGASISSLGVESRYTRYIFGNSSNQGQGDFVETIRSPQYILPNKTVLLIFKNKSTNNSENLGSHLRIVEPPRIPNMIIQNGDFVAYTGVVK